MKTRTRTFGSNKTFYFSALKQGRKLILFLVSFLMVSLTPLMATASSSVSYNFNTSGQLNTEFDSYISSGSFAQSNSGGIGNSGAINAPAVPAYAVFAPKAQYSIGPIGSTYTFSSLIKSEGGNGYSGMGFTADPSSRTAAVTTPAHRPQDALGVSVHGSGFIFHNGATNYLGYWRSDRTDATTNPLITTVVRYPADALIGDVTSSPDLWYKIVFIVERVGQSTFDNRVEVWPANADGSLRNPSGASAVFELNNVTNTTIVNSPTIRSYVNFSGYRVTYFDDYQVSLSGGSSVIEAGTPVVLTSAVLAQTNAVALDGIVTATGGTSVTERGFVYGLSANPTISDYKVPSGSGTGSFTELTDQLPNGTYYFRAYATNSTGTSYGSTQSVTITGSSVQFMPGTSPVSTPSSTTTQELAKTGSDHNLTVLLAFTGFSMLIFGGYLAIHRQRRSQL